MKKWVCLISGIAIGVLGATPSNVSQAKSLVSKKVAAEYKVAVEYDVIINGKPSQVKGVLINKQVYVPAHSIVKKMGGDIRVKDKKILIETSKQKKGANTSTKPTSNGNEYVSSPKDAIIHTPNEILYQVAQEVSEITPDIQKLLTDMAKTMYDAKGVGLAAPQIGVSKRVIVVDVGDEHSLIEMVNPVIIATEGEQFGTEGCLSVPGPEHNIHLVGDVRRHEKVTVKGLDRNGKEITVEATGLLARAFQHEVGHLNGQLFTSIAEKVYEIKADRKAK